MYFEPLNCSSSVSVSAFLYSAREKSLVYATPKTTPPSLITAREMAAAAPPDADYGTGDGCSSAAGC